MAIFYRRDIQQMLTRAADYMQPKTLRKTVDKLNCLGKSEANAKQVARRALQTEWELAVSDAAHKVGLIQFEKTSGGAAKLDIQFKSRDAVNPVEFAFDITAISDQHAEELQSAVRAEMAWLIDRLEDEGLGCFPMLLDFGTNVGSNGKFEPGIPRDDPEREWLLRKVIGATKALVASAVDEFLEIKREHIRFFVRRTSEGTLSWANNTLYSAPYSLTANPLSNALKNKSDQLARSGFCGLKGVLVCDASCDSIHQDVGGSVSKSTAQIVRSALKRFAYIDFVVALETLWEINHHSNVNRKVIVPQFFFREATAESRMRELLEEIVNALPSPAWDSTNAFARLESRSNVPGTSHYGGSSGDSDSIRISARALLRLLATDIDPNDFLQDHRLIADPRHPNKDVINFFAHFLRQRRSIVGSHVETDGDDEWITFKFGDTEDPALSPYQAGQ